MKYFICLFIFTTTVSTAQQPLVEDHLSLKADRFIGVDKFKNIYYKKQMILHKAGPLGDFVFRDYQLGPISSVDLINPFNVVVFYEEANTVVLLDNRLNEINRINFNEQDDLLMLRAARNAGNNRLWIFDMNSQQVELYNYRNGRKMPVSQPITEELTWMEGDFNYCYVLAGGYLKKYNIYGSFLWEVKAHEVRQIKLTENRLALLSSTNLLLTDPENGALISQVDLSTYLSEKGQIDLQLNGDFLYLYNGIELRVIALGKPGK